MAELARTVVRAASQRRWRLRNQPESMLWRLLRGKLLCDSVGTTAMGGRYVRDSDSVAQNHPVQLG